MSHEITATDAVVYARGTEVPWHGLASEVDPNLSAIEAMNAAGRGWSVSQQPALRAKQTGELVKEGYKYIVRNDTDTVLGIAGDGYSPLQNVEAFQAFQTVLDTGMAKMEVVGSIKGGQCVWALAKIQVDPEEIVKGDTVASFVALNNWHTGKRAIRFGLTNIREVCANTIAGAENSTASKMLRVLHKGDVQLSVQMAAKALDLAAREFRVTASEYRKMAAKAISASDLRQYVKVVLELEESATNKRATNLIDKVSLLATNGKGQTGDLTVWAGYNAITEHLTWNAGRSADNRLSSLWFGPNSQTLQRAHTEALKLAA